MYESGEDYLETIYLLSKKNGVVHSIDVARDLGFSRPSVSRAVGILKNDGYLIMNEDSELILTEKGLTKAIEVFDKHKALTSFLMLTAGVNEDIAETDACRIEHIISPETYEGIKKFMRSDVVRKNAEKLPKFIDYESKPVRGSKKEQ